MLRTKLAVCSVALGLFACMATTPPAMAQNIGEVELVRVWAYGTPPGGNRNDLRRTMPVQSGELVETVRTGELRIAFADGTTLGLGSQSSVLLDEMVYNGTQADSLSLELTSGFFHFVTGDIAKEAVRITTPAMVIGVRGTDLAISIDQDGNTEVGVRDGIATATPTAGGDTVTVGTGQTVSASPGDRSVGVSDGLSPAAGGTMPGAGVGTAGGRSTAGSGSSGGGGSEVERETHSSSASGSDSTDAN